MPNTTDNFDIPFLDGTELVRDYPQFSEDLAEAIDDGLIAARGLVAVKSALKTDAESFTSVGASGNVAVTNLSITHEVADPANRLIISAYFGAAASDDGRGRVGIAVAEDGTLIGIGDAAGSRTQVGAGGRLAQTGGGEIVAMPSVTFVHTPGAGSKTYTVRAINITNAARPVFINRSEGDGNNNFQPRSASALVIQEVAV